MEGTATPCQFRIADAVVGEEREVKVEGVTCQIGCLYANSMSRVNEPVWLMQVVRGCTPEWYASMVVQTQQLTGLAPSLHFKMGTILSSDLQTLDVPIYSTYVSFGEAAQGRKLTTLREFGQVFTRTTYPADAVELALDAINRLIQGLAKQKINFVGWLVDNIGFLLPSNQLLLQSQVEEMIPKIESNERYHPIMTQHITEQLFQRGFLNQQQHAHLVQEGMQTPVIIWSCGTRSLLLPSDITNAQEVINNNTAMFLLSIAEALNQTEFTPDFVQACIDWNARNLKSQQIDRELKTPRARSRR